MGKKGEPEQIAMGPDLSNSVPHKTIKLSEIGNFIRAKRQQYGLTLEEASQQSGVSIATLWRLERKVTDGSEKKAYTEPDMRTLTKIAKWLDVYVERVIDAEPVALVNNPSSDENATTPDFVAAHLRADRNLNPETAEALARMFRVAYEQFSPLRGKDKD